MNHSCSHSVNVMAPFNMCQDLPVGEDDDTVVIATSSLGK